MQPDQPSSTPTPPSPAPIAGRNPVVAALGAFFDNPIISWFVIPIVLVVILHFYVFSAFHVVGTSMLPTLQNSDYLIVSEVGRSVAQVEHKDYVPARGQIIVFHYPKDPSLDFVKRVIALPGERVVINNCTVTVYNAQNPQGFDPDQHPSHLTNGSCTQSDTEGSLDETVPAGNIFVLGDNRTPGGSSDSRVWGYLPTYDIIGNAVLRLYPFSNVRIF
jgi:signal peptidase I